MSSLICEHLTSSPQDICETRKLALAPHSLLLTLQTLFEVSANVPFSVPRPYPGDHTTFNHTVTKSPPVCSGFSIFPCFSWLFLSSNGQRFCRISLTLGWSDVCLVILLGLPVWREKATEMKGSLLHITSEGTT